MKKKTNRKGESESTKRCVGRRTERNRKEREREREREFGRWKESRLFSTCSFHVVYEKEEKGDDSSSCRPSFWGTIAEE